MHAERPAGGIVDVDAPALQLDRDAARQPAVRRDQRGDFACTLHRAAQDRADGERLLALVRRLDDGDAVDGPPPFFRGKRRRLAPALRRARRTHRFGDETPAGPQRSGGLAERLDILAANAEPLQEHLQAVLRMSGAGRLALARADGVQAFAVEALVETGQHHGAVRQPGDGGEQRRRRRAPSRSSRRR